MLVNLDGHKRELSSILRSGSNSFLQVNFVKHIFYTLFIGLLLAKNSHLKILPMCWRQMKLLQSRKQRQSTSNKMKAAVTAIRNSLWMSLIRKLRKKVSLIYYFKVTVYL